MLPVFLYVLDSISDMTSYFKILLLSLPQKNGMDSLKLCTEIDSFSPKTNKPKHPLSLFSPQLEETSNSLLVLFAKGVLTFKIFTSLFLLLLCVCTHVCVCMQDHIYQTYVDIEVQLSGVGCFLLSWFWGFNLNTQVLFPLTVSLSTYWYFRTQSEC